MHLNMNFLVDILFDSAGGEIINGGLLTPKVRRLSADVSAIKSDHWDCSGDVFGRTDNTGKLIVMHFSEFWQFENAICYRTWLS